MGKGTIGAKRSLTMITQSGFSLQLEMLPLAYTVANEPSGHAPSSLD